MITVPCQLESSNPELSAILPVLDDQTESPADLKEVAMPVVQSVFDSQKESSETALPIVLSFLDSQAKHMKTDTPVVLSVLNGQVDPMADPKTTVMSYVLSVSDCNMERVDTVNNVETATVVQDCPIELTRTSNPVTVPGFEKLMEHSAEAMETDVPVGLSVLDGQAETVQNAMPVVLYDLNNDPKTAKTVVLSVPATSDHGTCVSNTSSHSDQPKGITNMSQQQAVANSTGAVFQERGNNQDIVSSGGSACGDENQSPNSSEKRNHVDCVNIQRSKKKHASTEMKFLLFTVNWAKISDHVMVRLHAMQDFRNANPSSAIPAPLRITKKEITTLTTGVVDQLRMIDTEIGAVVMETVSRSILQKFPGLESTDDDGFGAGQGHIELKYKMINRNNYLNRFKTEITSTTATSLKKNRNARAGTIKEYWTISSSQCNKEILSKLSRDEPNLLTDEFLSESQAYTRFRLDDKIDTASMVSKLPVLRRRKLLNFHFEKATGKNVNIFQKYFTSKRDKIAAYSLTCKPNLHLSEKASDIDILSFLCSLVGENFKDLVHIKEIGTRVDDITISSPGPSLVAVDIGNNKSVFYVYANETRLSEGACDIISAMEDLFVVHFVHNFMYQNATSKFLELLQEYFFKIITLVGSKSTATRVGQRQRIVRKIISALSNFEMGG